MRNCEGTEIFPACKLTSQLVTPPWMLTEDGLLPQRRSFMATVQQEYGHQHICFCSLCLQIPVSNVNGPRWMFAHTVG